MNRTMINYIIDIPLMILTILEGLSSIFLQFGARHASYLELSMSEWKQVHIMAGMPMVILFIIHLALHWRWVVCVTKNTFGPNKKSEASTCPTN